jgi:hypothetical protein
MPLAEALAAGIPSACSDIPPLRWVGGGAAHYFDPLSVSAICEALERIAFDDEFRAAAALAGPRQARHFDWDKTAAKRSTFWSQRPASPEKYSSDSAPARDHVKIAIDRPRLFFNQKSKLLSFSVLYSKLMQGLKLAGIELDR